MLEPMTGRLLLLVLQILHDLVNQKPRNYDSIVHLRPCRILTSAVAAIKAPTAPQHGHRSTVFGLLPGLLGVGSWVAVEGSRHPHKD